MLLASILFYNCRSINDLSPNCIHYYVIAFSQLYLPCPRTQLGLHRYTNKTITASLRTMFAEPIGREAPTPPDQHLFAEEYFVSFVVRAGTLRNVVVNTENEASSGASYSISAISCSYIIEL